MTGYFKSPRFKDLIEIHFDAHGIVYSLKSTCFQTKTS